MSLNEENARITLLGCIMTLYVFLGAAIIKKFESPFEKKLLHNYWKIYEDFEEKLLNGTAKIDELKLLLYNYGNITSALGVPGKYERWNFLGCLHFVVTIVTTIGYGSYTPNTNAGKIFVILYGFLGCAGGILFFNLFLERMITFLAFILRELYVRKLISRIQNSDNDIDKNTEELIAEWKPSIYSVMLCLFICVITIGFVAVPAYSILEDWSYVEAAYFCFVSFATIGFGDFVAAQNYHHNNFYVLANIVILAIGCCFLYSVFNVISIVLKQILNWFIYRLKAIKVLCCFGNSNLQSERMLRKYSLKMQKERRQCHRRKSSIRIIRRVLRRKPHPKQISFREHRTRYGVSVINGADDSATNRKLSDDGLISMKDFFTSNQVSLALMQKQLQESAQQQSENWNHNSAPVFSSSTNKHLTSIESVPSTNRYTLPTTSAAFSSRHPLPTVCVTSISKHPVPAVPTIVSSSNRSAFPAGRFIPGTIGPLAILCDKLGDK